MGFGTIVPEMLSEICEYLTYTSPTYAMFTVFVVPTKGQIYSVTFTYHTLLTLIPRGASSNAVHFVNWSSAALDIQYAVESGYLDQNDRD